MRALGLKIGRIVIDAGHGGHDSGTLGAGGIEEKDVVLDVALRLGKLLHDRLGAEIVYTRADDTFIPLETRTAIANKAQEDLFTDELGHGRPPLQAIVAYCNYAVIYRRSPVGLPVPSLLKKAKREAWDEKFNRTLQELAWETVTSYSYSGVTAAKKKKE